MNTHELYDRIQTWIWLYDQIPLPKPQTELAKVIKEETERQWDMGLLFNASELEIVEELKGSTVEHDLNNIITYAKRFDRSKLGEIYSILIKIREYMYKNKLY